MRATSILILFGLSGCGQSPEPTTDSAGVIEDQPRQPRIISEIKTPPGFTRIKNSTGSFAEWLRSLPLKKEKQVYLYNGKLKPNQSAQFAVVDIATGKKDLQQCADVAMRLRAEYLFASKRWNEIAFMDYNNKWYKWTGGDDRTIFEPYLEQVFGWCGSASLEKQMKAVEKFELLEPGDVLVKGGFPGHAMIIADMAINEKGEKIFMLLQGYQPAQDMHIVINPNDTRLSPWYSIPSSENIVTPEWTFQKKHLRKW